MNTIMKSKKLTNHQLELAAVAAETFPPSEMCVHTYVSPTGHR